MGASEWLLLLVLSVLWGGSFFFVTLVVAHLLTRDEHLSGAKLAAVLIGFAGVAVIIGADSLAGLGDNNLAQIDIDHPRDSSFIVKNSEFHLTVSCLRPTCPRLVVAVEWRQTLMKKEWRMKVSIEYCGM